MSKLDRRRWQPAQLPTIHKVSLDCEGGVRVELEAFDADYRQVQSYPAKDSNQMRYQVTLIFNTRKISVRQHASEPAGPKIRSTATRARPRSAKPAGGKTTSGAS